MSTSTQRQERVESDPVDATFDTLFLGVLRQVQQRFEGIFPDRRLFKVFGQLLKGLIGAGVPIITRIAAAVIQSDDPGRAFHLAKRYYRWLDNQRFRHQDLLRPAYAPTSELFGSVKDDYVLVVLDFSNLEKPYGYEFEKLCTLKATGRRPGPRLRKGLVPGYNQLVSLAMTTDRVGLTCARTISYVSQDFVSLNRDILRAIRYSHVILAEHKLRFVCDSQFDDEKTFGFTVGLQEEFVFRLHHNRTLLVDRKRRQVLLQDLVPTIRHPIRFDAHFKAGGCWRKCQVNLGDLKVSLPGHERPYWLIVSEVPALGQIWILLTNVPIRSVKRAQEIWFNYRRRWDIEQKFRFLKKEGLRIEDFKVLPLENIRRLVNIALLAALLILNGQLFFPKRAWRILLRLGGKMGLNSEKDGPYLLMRGLSKLFACLAVLTLLRREGLLDSLFQLLDTF